MKGLLAKFLQKKGIESADQLSKDERIVFDNYDRILSKETLTLDDLRQFLNTQITLVENKWKDYNIEKQAKAELIAYHTVYKSILQAIDAPMAEREALERYLTAQM